MTFCHEFDEMLTRIFISHKSEKVSMLLKCYKNTFLYSIFFYLKTIYIYIQSKKYFCCVRILSFKENIFILNQNILLFKNSYIQPEFFSYKKYIFIHAKKMCSMKLFYSMIFGSQIWSSIC